MASIEENTELSSPNSQSESLFLIDSMEPESPESSEVLLQKQLIEESEGVLGDLQEILGTYPKKPKIKKSNVTAVNSKLNTECTSSKGEILNEVNLHQETCSEPESRQDNLKSPHYSNETVESRILQVDDDALREAGVVATNSNESEKMTDLVTENCEDETEILLSPSPECINLIPLAKQMKSCYIPLDQSEVVKYLSLHGQKSCNPEQSNTADFLQSKPEEPIIADILQSKFEEPIAAYILQSEPEEPIIADVLHSKPEEPIIADILQSKPEEPITAYILQSEPEEPIIADILQSKSEKTVTTDVLQTKTEEPITADVLQPKPEEPITADVLQPKPEEPITADVLQPPLEYEPLKTMSTSRSRRLVCSYCNITYKYAITLRRHKAVFHNAEPVCKYCNHFFIHLENHMYICKLRPQVVEGTPNFTPITSKSTNSTDEEIVHLKSVQISEHDSNSAICINKNTSQQNRIKTPDNDSTYYYCGLCQKVFASNEALQNHKILLHNTETKCFKCSDVFSSFIERDKHMKSCKKELPLAIEANEDNNLRKRKCTGSFSCIIPDCKKSFPFMFSLKRHCDSVHSRDFFPSCKDCQKIFYLQEEQLDHICTSMEVRTKKKICPECQNTYTNVQKHQGQVHGSRPFCPACECMFKSLEELELHLEKCPRMRNKRPKLKCSGCNYLFITKFQRRIHEACVHSSEPVCMICNVFFETYDMLQTHTVQIHGNSSEQVSMAVIDCDSGMINAEESNSEIGDKGPFPLLATSIDSQYSHNGTNNFVCLVCSSSFQFRKSCIKHIIQAHRRKCPADSKKSKTESSTNEFIPCSSAFYCYTCKKSLPNGYLFEKHKMECKSATRATVTDYNSCNDSLINSNSATSVETNSKVRKQSKVPINITHSHFQCPLCVAIMRTQKMLDMHMKYFHNIHNEELPSNICTVCGYQCSSLSSLEQHMSKIHGVNVSDVQSPTAQSSTKTIKKQSGPKSKNSSTSYPETVSLVTSPNKNRPTSSYKKPPDQLCNICNKYVSHLRRHKAVAHNTEPICRSCHKYFPTFESVDYHVSNCYSHKRIKERKPALLKKKSASSASSLNKLPQIKCTGKMLYRSRTCKSIPLICEYCSATYSRLDSLRKHINVNHQHCRKLSSCSFCQAHFKYDYQLQQHLVYCDKKRKAMNSNLQTSVSLTSDASNDFVNLPTSVSLTSDASNDFVNLPTSVSLTSDASNDFVNLPTSASLTSDASNDFVTSENAQLFEYVNLNIKKEIESDDVDSTLVENAEEAIDVNCEQNSNRDSNKYHDNTQFPTNACSSCNVSFTTVIDLKLHMNLKHDGTYLLCEPCKLEFKNVPEFVGHIHSCQKSKEYQSNELHDNCQSLQVHDVKHIKEENFDMI